MTGSIMSKMTKSIGKINLSIFMSRFLTIPFGMHLVLSAISITILIGLSFPIPKHLNMKKGIMLMLDLRSTKALLKSNLPIEQGRIKLPRSFYFRGNRFWRRAEHLGFILTSSSSSQQVATTTAAAVATTAGSSSTTAGSSSTTTAAAVATSVTHHRSSSSHRRHSSSHHILLMTFSMTFLNMSVGLTCLEHTDLSINAQSTEVDAPPVNDDNANANEDNAEDDAVAHVLDDDDVEVSDDDEVNPSTNVEEVLSSDDSDDDN
ncbi:hypothetical protein Tco_0222235 [Tanacetum coccineum]